jgi:hypothetical protein
MDGLAEHSNGGTVANLWSRRGPENAQCMPPLRGEEGEEGRKGGVLEKSLSANNLSADLDSHFRGTSIWVAFGRRAWAQIRDAWMAIGGLSILPWPPPLSGAAFLTPSAPLPRSCCADAQLPSPWHIKLLPA